MKPHNIVQFCTNIYNKYKHNQMRYEPVRVQRLRHAEVAFRSSSSLSEAENYSLRCGKVLSVCTQFKNSFAIRFHTKVAKFSSSFAFHKN